MDIIDELFSGEVYGAERPAPDTPEYHEAICIADKSYRQLIDIVNITLHIPLRKLRTIAIPS